MKNLFFAAAVVALACAGCATEDDPVIPGLDSCPVDFSTSIAEITRSTPVAGTAFADGASVAVFGIEKKTGALDAGNTAWMSNVQLTNNAGTWSYTGEKTFMKGYEYQFYAYAPFRATPLTLSAPTAVSYSVPTAIADQEDFMYAVNSKNFSTAGPAADEEVGLSFSHALSQVKFKAQTGKEYSSYYAVKIKSIKLSGLATAGTLDFTKGVWNLGDSPATDDYVLPIDDKVLSASEALLTSGNDVLMLIPQNPQKKTLELTLEVTAVADMGDTNVAAGLKTVTVAFPADDTAWVAGHAYTYAITLNLDSALGWQVAGFSAPTISDWITNDPDRPITNK